MKISAVGSLAMLTLFTGCVFGPQHSNVIVQNVPPMPLTSPGTKYFFLPAEVKHTVLVYGGASEIRDINELQTDRPMYEVDFRNSRVHPALFILDDGTLVNVKSSAHLRNPLNHVATPHLPSTLDQRKSSP